VYGTLMFGESQIRSSHMVVGMLKTSSLRNALYGISRQFEKIKLEHLGDNFAKLLSASPEAQMTATDGLRAAARRRARPAAPSRRPRWASRKP
jgi:type VI secretion system protein VasG